MRATKLVEINRDRANEPEETDFTERVLLSMVFDISLLHETVQRIRVQVFAMAKDRGLSIPPLEK